MLRTRSSVGGKEWQSKHNSGDGVSTTGAKECWGGSFFWRRRRPCGYSMDGCRGGKERLRMPIHNKFAKIGRMSWGKSESSKDDEGVWAPHLVLLMQLWDLIGEAAQTAW